MKIEIRSLQNKIRINKKKVLSLARFVLSKEKKVFKELSLVFVTDAFIKKLNKKYKKKNKTTDVLAFLLDKGIGEVIVSVDTAKREAVLRKIPFHQELMLYVIHGILHLLGYRDTTKNKREIMEEQQDYLLNLIWSQSRIKKR